VSIPDRPAPDEIEITPEMIEAGELAYLEYDRLFEDRGEMIRRVFTAMAEAGGIKLSIGTRLGHPWHHRG
jgi:hypothetical protein